MLVSGFSRAAWISALCHKTFCGNADIRCTAVVVEAVNRETRLSIESNADPLQSEIGRDVCSSAVGARLASVAHTRAISRIFFWIYRHREIVEVYQGKGNNGRWRSSRCIQCVQYRATVCQTRQRILRCLSLELLQPDFIGDLAHNVTSLLARPTNDEGDDTKR
jgi:hypothetical protein